MWVPEITHHAPGVPFVLVGLKRDLRDVPGIPVVPVEQGREVADKLGAAAYLECSSLRDGHEKLADAVEEAVRLGMQAKAASK